MDSYVADLLSAFFFLFFFHSTGCFERFIEFKPKLLFD